MPQIKRIITSQTLKITDFIQSIPKQPAMQGTPYFPSVTRTGNYTYYRARQ